MGELVNESAISGFGRKDAIQQKLEPQRDLRRFRYGLLGDRKFQMLPGCRPFDRSRSLRTVSSLGDPHPVALRIFDGQLYLSADLAVTSLERVAHFGGRGKCIRQWRGV